MNTSKKVPFYKKWYTIVIAILIIITIIFNQFFTIIVISGESMMPNFQNGNIMLAIRKYDLWRFDVVTIASKKANMIVIKRIIGLPNEKIEYKNNQLYVNGKCIIDSYNFGNTEDFSITLKNDEYLCLGDNREHSLDSRALGAFSKDEIFAKVN